MGAKPGTSGNDKESFTHRRLPAEIGKDRTMGTIDINYQGFAYKLGQEPLCFLQ